MFKDFRMAENIPWLSDSFFVAILQSEHECGSVSVIRWTSESAVDVGNNFMSTVLRVKLTYKEQGQSNELTRLFIVKAPLADGVINENIFVENEVQMYKDFIPKSVELSKLDIFPKTYKCPLANCLVLEDLNETGYVMCEEGKRLDHKQAKAALAALAKFHAVSVAMKHTDPDCIERNGVETCYTNDPKYAARFKPRILMRLYGVATVLKTIKDCEKYGDLLNDASEEFWKLMVEVFKPNSKMNVLNHGDFWKNNILFKYSGTGLVSGVKIIDYQMRRYCSPGIDLLYLFWTSADNGVRLRMYELLEFYRHTLNNTLAELRCPERLLRHELKEEISKCSPIILLISLFLPVIYPDPDVLVNLNESQTPEESLHSLNFDINPILIPFKGKHYRQLLPEICKELEYMKIFQVLLKNKKKKRSV